MLPSFRPLSAPWSAVRRAGSGAAVRTPAPEGTDGVGAVVDAGVSCVSGVSGESGSVDVIDVVDVVGATGVMGGRGARGPPRARVHRSSRSRRRKVSTPTIGH